MSKYGLIGEISDAALNWVIGHLGPRASRLADEDRRTAAELGLSLCRVAAVCSEWDLERATLLFKAGAGILGVAAHKPFESRYKELLDLPAVRQNPMWRWDVLRALLSFPHRAYEVFMESLELELEKDEKDLRDRLVLDLLTRQMDYFEMSEDCLRHVAERVMSGTVSFSTKLIERKIVSAAKAILKQAM